MQKEEHAQKIYLFMQLLAYPYCMRIKKSNQIMDIRFIQKALLEHQKMCLIQKNSIRVTISREHYNS